jgi:UDP-2-acetamido-2-deoxy-ribo-hexuluronate aminotransferase
MIPIQMVDLKRQYLKIKNEVDAGIQEVIDTTAFINGKAVQDFQKDLEQYLNVKHIIPCANGTDALQIGMMALGFKVGDEIITPSYTYIATVEVMGLLGLKPVFVEVDKDTFNIDITEIESKITPKTVAIVPVHLYGQCADMEPLMAIAKKYNLKVIEDTAQAIGAEYIFSNGTVKKAGTIGHIGCTSFFPSKNLGCYGDGGAIFTNDDELASRLRMISNHGQAKRYYHELIGVNSRLDTIQAAILKVKLKHLDNYAEARRKVANAYDDAFSEIIQLTTPFRTNNSTHVFHQYTLKTSGVDRDKLKQYLEEHHVPSMIYYPVPVHLQNAFSMYGYKKEDMPLTESLCECVISLPIHTEMDDEQLYYVVTTVKDFFSRK